MNKKLAKYIAAGVVAKIGMEMYARDTFEAKTGHKFEGNKLSNYFKKYTFKRFVEDGIHVVTWPVTAVGVFIGGKIIDGMSEDEFYEKYPEYKKYRKN